MYPLAVQSWERNWDHLPAFLLYPVEVRKLIYTTNVIESFNASLRKFTQNKKVFPTDDAALKSIYLAAQQIRKNARKQDITMHRFITSCLPFLKIVSCNYYYVSISDFSQKHKILVEPNIYCKLISEFASILYFSLYKT